MSQARSTTSRRSGGGNSGYEADVSGVTPRQSQSQVGSQPQYYEQPVQEEYYQEMGSPVASKTASRVSSRYQASNVGSPNQYQPSNAGPGSHQQPRSTVSARSPSQVSGSGGQGRPASNIMVPIYENASDTGSRRDNQSYVSQRPQSQVSQGQPQSYVSQGQQPQSYVSQRPQSQVSQGQPQSYVSQGQQPQSYVSQRPQSQVSQGQQPQSYVSQRPQSQVSQGQQPQSYVSQGQQPQSYVSQARGGSQGRSPSNLQVPAPYDNVSEAGSARTIRDNQAYQNQAYPNQGSPQPRSSTGSGQHGRLTSSALDPNRPRREGQSDSASKISSWAQGVENDEDDIYPDESASNIGGPRRASGQPRSSTSRNTGAETRNSLMADTVGKTSIAAQQGARTGSTTLVNGRGGSTVVGMASTGSQVVVDRHAQKAGQQGPAKVVLEAPDNFRGTIRAEIDTRSQATISLPESSSSVKAGKKPAKKEVPMAIKFLSGNASALHGGKDKNEVRKQAKEAGKRENEVDKVKEEKRKFESKLKRLEDKLKIASSEKSQGIKLEIHNTKQEITKLKGVIDGIRSGVVTYAVTADEI